jgi:hypothetical protein
MSLVIKAMDALRTIGSEKFLRILEYFPQTQPLFMRYALSNHPEEFKNILKYWKDFPLEEKLLKELEKQLREIRDLNILKIAIEQGEEFIDLIIYFAKGMEEYILKRIFEQEDISVYYYEKYNDYYIKIKKNQKLNELEKRLKAMKKIEERIISSRERLEKLVASKKIVAYLEDAMYDEFEMKPLVTRIDMRKFRELMEEK